MPLLQRPFLDELAPEMEALSSEYRSVVESMWGEWLDDRLAAAGGIEVRRTRTNLAGDRVKLRLVDGVLLHLELSESERSRAAVLHSLARSFDGGWTLRGTTPAGDLVTFRAARIRVERA